MACEMGCVVVGSPRDRDRGGDGRTTRALAQSKSVKILGARTAAAVKFSRSPEVAFSTSDLTSDLRPPVLLPPKVGGSWRPKGPLLVRKGDRLGLEAWDQGTELTFSARKQGRCRGGRARMV